MKSILVTNPLPQSALDILSKAGDLHVAGPSLNSEGLRRAVAGRQAIVCLLTDRIDAACFDAAGASLKIVANVAVGVDNVDLTAARQRSVIVTNTPDVLTGAVAELTWGLILAVTHRIGEAERLLRRGAWTGWSMDFLNGTELSGKRLGIIGAGRIGRAVAAKAQAFGMQVCFARHKSRSSIDGHPTVTLDELLKSSDVISVNVPLRPDTKHLINERALGLMKPTAFLINTARGPVVDEGALAGAIRVGRIAGAALDVFEREPQVHPDLLTLEQVVLTPHIGSATRETRAAMAELAAKNVVEVLAGRSPLTPV